MGCKCSFVKSGVDGIWKELSNPDSVLIVLRQIQHVGEINEPYRDSFEMSHGVNYTWYKLLNIQHGALKIPNTAVMMQILYWILSVV